MGPSSRPSGNLILIFFFTKENYNSKGKAKKLEGGGRPLGLP